MKIAAAVKEGKAPFLLIDGSLNFHFHSHFHFGMMIKHDFVSVSVSVSELGRSKLTQL